MRVGKVHPVLLAHHRALHQLGKFNEPVDTGLSPRAAVGDDDRILRIDQKFRGFPQSIRIAMRRRRLTKFGV